MRREPNSYTAIVELVTPRKNTNIMNMKKSIKSPIRIIFLFMIINSHIYINIHNVLALEETGNQISNNPEHSGQAPETNKQLINNSDDELLFQDFPATDITDDDIGTIPEDKYSLIQLEAVFELWGTYNYAHDAPAEGETDHRSLSALSPSLRIDFESTPIANLKLFISGKGYYDAAYDINGDNEYTDEVLDTYEEDIELLEAYLYAAINSFDLIFGRQIINWGKANNLNVVDVLNPRDYRVAYLAADVKDLRLPVTATRIDYDFQQWSVSGVAVHEIRFNKMPVYGNDFYPADRPSPYEEEIPDHGGNTQYGLNVIGRTDIFDISFYWARFFDADPHNETTSTGIIQKHSKLDMLGAALNYAYGGWIFTTEAALFEGLEFFGLPGEKKSRFDAVAGIEYVGIAETSIVFEARNRHISGYDPRLELTDYVLEDTFESVLRISRGFFHDSLHASFQGALFDHDGDGGSYYRLRLDYDANDSLSLTFGFIDYQSGDFFIKRKIGDNDRIFFGANYTLSIL